MPNTPENQALRKEAMALVQVERDRQDSLWGVQNHHVSVWLGILGEEFGEACEAVNETVFNNGPEAKAKGGYDNILRELSHVAAVALGAIECILRNT